jgi:hypothetical protein
MSEIIQTPNSSLLTGYAYDESAWILVLHMKDSNKVYEYLDVGPEVFDEFKSAKSLGGFYNSRLKGNFDSREITKVPTAPPVKEQLKASVADEMISDADIQRVDPNYKPQQSGNGGVVEQQVQMVEPQILSPEQALAVIAPKSPKADELTQRAHALAARVMTVTNAATQADMESHLVQLATLRKALFDLVDPYREIAYRAYEQIQQLNKSRLEPIDLAITSKKGALKGYLQAEQAKAQAEQRRLDAEARQRAEEEQRQRTEQMRLEAAEEKQTAGDTAGAEASLFDQTIQAPPVYTPPVRVEQPTSSLGKKGGVKENWKGEVSSLEDVILDVAEGIKASRECGNLRGHLPTTLIMINPTILKNLATTNKQMATFPGLRFWDDGTISVRTAKE